MAVHFSHRAAIALSLFFVGAAVLPCCAKDNVVTPNRKIEAFDLPQVRLLPSPFKNAQDKNAAYLLSVDADRLLARIRSNAGLEPRAKSYGGWESQSIAGHSLGHYLSAVSKTYASTGDVRFKERAEYIVAELAACQEASGDGLLAGDERCRAIFQEIKKGNIRSQGFDLNGLWVPWYVFHKIFAGLLDAYRYCDCDQALEVAKKFGDWAIDVTKDLSFEQMQKMLACEYGGTNDAFYSLYAATGDLKYLHAGDRFYDLAVIKPLSEGRDELNGRHANTQIPKIVGLARRYELAGNGDINAFPTADFFWNRVTKFHSYSIGGNSSGEHFGKPGILSTRLTNVTCETCNTYNMLKLTKELYMQSGDVAYADYFERALYNHILASLEPSDDKNRLYTYFVPLLPGGFRTYSSAEDSWTCCHGTGMENHAQYNGEIFYRGKSSDEADILYVNLLVPSKLDWQEKGAVVSIDQNGVFTVETQNALKLTVKIRIPNNCVVKGINANVEDGYYTVGTQWAKGQTSQKLPFFAEWKIEPTPDNPNVVAFFRGPVMYAGVVGPTDKPVVSQFNFGDGSKGAANVLPVIVSDSRTAETLISDAKTDALGSFFTTPSETTLSNAKPNDVTLTPFYAAKERYCAYFDFFSNEEWTAKEKEYLEEKAFRAKLAEATLSYFQPGEMQPERDANFNSEKSAFGEHMGRKWRDARDGGFFEFDVKVDPDKDCALVVTYWGDESGNREFDILVDGKKIAEQKLLHNKPGQFFNEIYPIPNPDKKQSVRVRFQGRPGAMAGGIFGARTIDAASSELVK